jgi:HK97 family phage prohead protease
MELEHKAFSVAGVKTGGPGEPEGVGEFIVSVFGNVDQGGEVVDQGFFAKDLASRLTADGRPKMKGTLGHDWNTVIAKTLAAKELLPGDPMLPPEIAANGGLWVKGQFNLETQAGKEAYSNIAGGFLDEFSIGYVTTKDAYDSSGNRHLKEGTTYEWAACLAGMNPATSTLSVKAAQAQKAVRTWIDPDGSVAVEIDDPAEPSKKIVLRHDRKAATAKPTCSFCDTGGDDSATACNCTSDCGFSDCGAGAKALDGVETKSGSPSVTVGAGYGNPFGGSMPGSYEERMSQLGDAVADMLPAWLVGPLLGRVDGFVISYDTCVRILATFDAEMMVAIIPDEWEEPDERFYLRVPYTADGGTITLGEPALQKPAFLPVSGKPAVETSSVQRLARETAIAVKALKAGRVISGQNMGHLQGAMASVQSAASHLQVLVDAGTTPDPNEAADTYTAPTTALPASVTKPGIQLAGLTNQQLWGYSNRVLLRSRGVPV